MSALDTSFHDDAQLRREPLPGLGDAVRARATRKVCEMAADAGEARVVLMALGLVEYGEGK